MKVTKEFIRGQIARIQGMVPRMVPNSAEEQLILGLRTLESALTAIEFTGSENLSPHCLPKTFALETDPPLNLGTFKELEQDENNPVRLWAEIWKLRIEANGPGEFATWRDAAVYEKRWRVEAQRELEALKDKVRELGQSIGMVE